MESRFLLGAVLAIACSGHHTDTTPEQDPLVLRASREAPFPKPHMTISDVKPNSKSLEEDKGHPNASGWIIPREIPPNPNMSGWIIPKEDSNYPNASGFIIPREDSVETMSWNPATGKKENIQTVSCGRHVLQPGSKVTLKTKNYPKPYPSRYKCLWTFQVDGDTASAEMNLKCQEFNLPICWRGSRKRRRRCLNNYLSVTHFLSGTKKKYRGKKGPQGVLFEGGTLNINLRTIAGFRAPGFTCTVEALPGVTTTTTPPPDVDVCDLQCGTKDSSSDRIVSGQESTVGEWPWVGGLTYRQSSNVFCGATLIHPEWALTAAHCAEAVKAEGIEVDLLLGAHDLLQPQLHHQRKQVAELKSHPLYEESTLDNDIALARLAAPAIITKYVRTACLKQLDSSLSQAVATGWGLLEEGGESSQVLQEVELGVVEWAACRNIYGDALTPNMICAGGTHRDACQGDSGGGLMSETRNGLWTVMGIVSWGYGCARPGYPGVYTDVTNFLPWVRATTGLDKCEPSGSSSGPLATSTQVTTTPTATCRCGRTNERIVGGAETSVNEYPWQVGLVRRRQTYPFCGGSIISPSYVLTAAHCTEPILKYKWAVEALVGYHHLTSTSSTPAAARIPIGPINQHSKYDPGTLVHDIAVIQLSYRLDLTADPRIAPVCLPRPGGLYEGASAIVTGWGRVTEGGSQSVKLQEVEVPVLSNAECEASYPGTIFPTFICAGYPEGGKDSCQGDSGGPLVIAGEGGLEQVGVVSWGSGCARPRKPGVYTRVTEYIDWISSATGSEGPCA